MKDISLFVGEHKLNFRVSAMIKNGNKILLHHGLTDNHYTLPGGRVKEGETTEQALKREMKEEMGYDIDILKPVSFMENMFTDKGVQFHELLVTYELQFKDKQVYNKDKIELIESCKDFEFVLMDISKLDNIIFLPSKLKDIIKNTTADFKHINIENKKDF